MNDRCEYISAEEKYRRDIKTYMMKHDAVTVPRVSGLTSQEEVILHLFALRDMHVDVEGPYAATREGMAHALNMRPNNVTRDIKVLESSDLVQWKIAHVLGFRKRVRIYNLTRMGKERAEDIIRSVKGIPVTFMDEFGAVQTLPLAKAYMRFGGRRSFLELLKSRDTGVELGRDATQSSVSSRVSGFFGRGEELASMSRWFSTDTSNILVLHGIAGIGKTSLVTNFARGIENRSKCYIKLHEWDSVRGIMDSIANAFVGMGDEKLSAQLESSVREEMPGFLITFKEALLRSSPLLIFDDLWMASDEL